MKRTLNLLAACLLTLTFTVSVLAQSNESKSAEHSVSESRPDYSQFVVKTYYLANVTQQSDANEILIALRNTLDHSVRMDLVPSQNAIVIEAPSDQQALAQRLITELDRPHKAWRLTFTIADSDNGKRVGIQHISMIVTAGQRTVLKQGDKIPVATGTYEAKNDTGTQTQFQYLDVGINVDATLEDTPSGLQLKSKIEQSSVGQPSMIAGVQEPVFRQTSVEGTSRLSPGKPIALGSIDVTGTTRHVDIEVVAEPTS